MPSLTASIETILMSLPGFLPARLDGLDRAERHVVVVREEQVDLLVRLQEASMTSLPLARVNSPVCDAMILNFGSSLR